MSPSAGIFPEDVLGPPATPLPVAEITPKPKQVIVMRTDLNMRKGKMIAQGAHASISWLARTVSGALSEVDIIAPERDFTDAQLEWISGAFTKICVGVGSEEELVRIHLSALEHEIVSYMIIDNGRTEFNNVPTKTCCAIGPDWSDRVDEITGELKLL